MDMSPSASKAHWLLDGESSKTPRESLVALDRCLDETRPSKNANKGKTSAYDPKVACGPKDKKLLGKKRNRAHMRLLSDEERREKKRYNVSTKPTLFTNRWSFFRKKLSDRNLGHESFLPLSNKFVDEHILICFPQDDQRMVQEGYEFTVNVYDHDTDSLHQIILKTWTKGRCYALCNGWPLDFFHRRALRIDDEIGLYWDRSDFKLHFCVLSWATDVSADPLEEKRYNVSTKLTLFTDRWTTKRKLTMSILSHKSYLPLDKWFVEDHILRYFPEDKQNMVQQGSELTVNVYDHDTESMIQLLLGKLTKDGSYALRNGWPLDFFYRRDLKKDDTIGLYWDRFDYKLHFSVLSRAPRDSAS